MVRGGAALQAQSGGTQAWRGRAAMPNQHRPVARNSDHAQPQASRLGQLLQLRRHLEELPGSGLVCLRPCARLSATASQGADARHPVFLRPAHLWSTRGAEPPNAADVNCVNLRVNSIGEPDAANLHVRFDERGAETEAMAWTATPALGESRRIQLSPMPKATAPLLDSTLRAS